MTSLAGKISSYNIFNYLFPGTLFYYIFCTTWKIKIPSENILVDFFILYFIGLLISRTGSLFIQPVIKKFFRFDHCPYCDYIEACQKDEKIELFSEINNTYRTLTSLFVINFFSCLIKMIVYIIGLTYYPFGQVEIFYFLEDNKEALFILLLSAPIAYIFILANQRQAEFLARRIKQVIKCKIITN